MHYFAAAVAAVFKHTCICKCICGGVYYECGPVYVHASASAYVYEGMCTLKEVLKKSTPVEEESKSYLDLNALNEESEELYEELPACDSSHDNLQFTQQKTLQDLPFKPRPVPRQRQPFSSIAVVTDDRMAQQTSESVHVDDSTALDK